MDPQPALSRTGAARRRSRKAKVAVGAAAAVVFTLAAGLARATYAGHSKQPTPPLVIPQPMYEVVRDNLLQAGVPMPSTAPPQATTHTS